MRLHPSISRFNPPATYCQSGEENLPRRHRRVYSIIDLADWLPPATLFFCCQGCSTCSHGWRSIIGRGTASNVQRWCAGATLYRSANLAGARVGCAWLLPAEAHVKTNDARRPAEKASLLDLDASLPCWIAVRLPIGGSRLSIHRR